MPGLSANEFLKSGVRLVPRLVPRLFSLHSKWIGLSGEIPIRRSSDVTSPFPPSGNEGYIRNRDVFISVLHLLTLSGRFRLVWCRT